MENLRPLTLEEQLFAAQNHNLVYAFLQEKNLPEDYLVNHISATFVETVSWWLSGNRKESPEEMTEYFLTLIRPVIEERG